MARVGLRKKHRNELLELIRAASLDPRRFSPEEFQMSAGGAVPDSLRLRLETSEVRFAISTRFSDDGQTFTYIMTDCRFSAEGPTGQYGAWSDPTNDFNQVKQSFENWLNSVAKKYFAYRQEEEEDLATPDLWAELKTSETTEDFSHLKNSQFSQQEQTRIADTLAEFEAEVERRQLLSPDEIQELHKQVTYLVDASKRLGRKDWVMAAIGTLFSFTVQSGLDGATASQLLQLATGGLQWIVTHMPLLTP